MKLLVHNMLTSRCIKGVTTGYPLKIVALEVKENSVEFNKDFIQKILPKMDWNVLYQAANNLNIDLPATPPQASEEENEEAYKKIHHALLEIEVIQGHLICPETGRKFPIQQGIPNMLINEDEV